MKPLPPSNRGVALVIVLGVLVLVLGLIVAFITRAGADRSSSASYAAANASRHLGDLAVNLVQGQINDATTRGADKAWTSQPGALRVFNTDGSLNTIYRLYSAPLLTTTTTTDLVGDVPPAGWATGTAHWCDLNAPATVDGKAVYPILDPPPGTGAEAVDGFSLGSPPNATTAQPAPMPVRWLYVLKDGSLVAPLGSGTTATVAGGSDSNPIIGRVAFWTDDDTCRVNINTASEGTYWDTPHANTPEEKKFANYQPAQKEFQRYPGHPAMTSLSAVFPGLSADQIYKITPRVIGGGSDKGTDIAPGSLDPDADRLYSSVGELLYNKDRGTNGLARNQLEKAKFFLTAHSRAPEVNLFSKPRVCLWPIAEGMPAAKTTTFDKLIAFCSTVNGQKYYFQRSKADSSSADIAIENNANLYSYLQALTVLPVPGFGGVFNAKYPADRDQILTEIFDYIRCTNLSDDLLTAGNQFTDGYSGATGYLAGHGWVAPTIKGTTRGFGRTYTLSELAIVFICNAVADDPATASIDESSGSNVPANKVLPGGTPLVAGEKYIQAVILPEFFTVMEGWTGMRPEMQVTITGLQGLNLSWTDISTGTIKSANLGFPSNGTTTYDKSAGDLIHGRSNFGPPTWRYAVYAKRSDADSGGASPYPFISIPLKLTGVPAVNGNMTFTGGNVTIEIKNTGTGEVVQTLNLHLPGGTFPIPNLVTDAPSDTSNTPSGTDAAPIPKSMWWAFSRDGSGVDVGVGGRLKNVAKDTAPPLTKSGNFFHAGFDTVRSILPRHGDFRLIAATATLNDTANAVFVKHPRYDDITKRMAHTFSGLRSHESTGKDVDGKYFSSLTYSPGQAPDIPSGAAPVDRPEATGDFSVGTAHLSPDGPLIGKPDEGNLYRGASGNEIPYFDNDQTQEAAGRTFFAPNRQVPSAGMLGSLPTGVKSGVPWKTLLFRPQTTHPAHSASISDHLLMDLFWMPVVEPYAISEPFSTSGKINMNYQIVPFTYLTRSTGIQALLKSEKVAAIPNASTNTGARGNTLSSIRQPVSTVETLKQFERKFAANDVFKSASEICDIHIIPLGTTLNTSGSDADTVMAAFWAANAATGENLRERIYTTLYPRLTTKSNSYTVYFTVQSLRNPASAAQDSWNDGLGKVISEYRGSTSLERYIDPADSKIPDFLASPASPDTLDKFYRWRITGNRQFAP